MQVCPLASSSVRRSAALRRRDHGFTLIELLVVIGIIIVLIGILLPVVHKIRIAAQVASTRSWLNELSSAIEHYQQDFKAYPGPLANNEMDLADTSTTTFTPGGYTTFGYPTVAPAGYDTTSQAANGSSSAAALHLTMSENLVLGLLGGLHADTTTATQLDYDPSSVGGGPISLGTFASAGNKRYPPYIDSNQLSWTTGANGKTGHFNDASGHANDSIIPCFLDRFADPMPILYMRAKVGASPQPGQVTAGVYSDVFNPIVTDDFSEISAPAPAVPGPAYAVRQGQYDVSQIVAYTGAYTGTWPGMTRATAPNGTSIGIGKSANLSKYTVAPIGSNLYHGLQMTTWTAPPYPPTTPSMASQYPYDAYPYLVGSSGQVRQKDGYILISAGADRVYGTEDDICNFGDVTP